jgi:predicted metalloprotease with PDZ domain
MSVKKDGTIFDVLPGTPAYEAGLGPNMTVLAVDGHVYSADALNESIARPQNGKISLVVRNFSSVEAHQVHYSGSAACQSRAGRRHSYLWRAAKRS